MVLQETTLFAATIRENIAFGKPDATQAEIEAAAKDAQAHDFILQMVDGYDTEVGERGITLSGGKTAPGHSPFAPDGSTDFNPR